jgi:serine/tyrosine/threonine adenylyltransferase
MTIGWHFDNTYSKLSETFKEEIKPIPVKNPELVILNEQLAKELNLDFSNISQQELSKLLLDTNLATLQCLGMVVRF